MQNNSFCSMVIKWSCSTKITDSKNHNDVEFFSSQNTDFSENWRSYRAKKTYLQIANCNDIITHILCPLQIMSISLFIFHSIISVK